MALAAMPLAAVSPNFIPQAEATIASSTYSVDLFENGSPSDLVLFVGQEVEEVARTNDPLVNKITFTWTDESGFVAFIGVVQNGEPLTEASEFTVFDWPGEWTLTVDFGNGQTIQKTIHVSLFVLPESPIGVIALSLASLGSLGGFVYFRMNKQTKSV
jgi:hypothetical protein